MRCVALQCPNPGWTAVRGCPCSVRCSCKSWFGFQELEAIKARVREMEKEDERLKELQLEAETRLIMSSEAGMGCPCVLLCPPVPSPSQGQLWVQGGDRHQRTPLCLCWQPETVYKVGAGWGPRHGMVLRLYPTPTFAGQDAVNLIKFN